MGRNGKVTVEWFPHQVHQKKTLAILRKLYKNEGYAFWFLLLEILASSSKHYYDFSDKWNRLYFSGYVLLPEEKCNEILNLLCELKSIDKELWIKNQIIWSDNFVEGLKMIYKKRSIDLPQKPKISVSEKDGNPETKSDIFGNSSSNLKNKKETIEKPIESNYSVSEKVGNPETESEIPLIECSILNVSNIFNKESEEPLSLKNS